MRDWQTSTHMRWECKYHLVLVPKYRKRVIFGRLRKEIGPILRELFRHKGVEVVEGCPRPDHIHVCVSIPPKHGVASIVGFVKGKSAIQIHRRYLGRSQNDRGCHFWSCGYCVSTVDLNEAMIREYIQNQDEQERREEQLGFVLK